MSAGFSESMLSAHCSQQRIRAAYTLRSIPESETPLRADFKLENSAMALAELRGYLGRCHQSLLQLGSDCSADPPPISYIAQLSFQAEQCSSLPANLHVLLQPPNLSTDMLTFYS